MATGELNLITSHCILYFVQWKCSCRQSTCFKNRLDKYWKDMGFWSYAGSSFGFCVKKLQQHCYRYLVTTSLSNEIGNFKVVLCSFPIWPVDFTICRLTTRWAELLASWLLLSRSWQVGELLSYWHFIQVWTLCANSVD